MTTNDTHTCGHCGVLLTANTQHKPNCRWFGPQSMDELAAQEFKKQRTTEWMREGAKVEQSFDEWLESREKFYGSHLDNPSLPATTNGLIALARQTTISEVRAEWTRRLAIREAEES